ncbi:hypothetical protein Vi05172_g9104 [Venturia inaequalis]|nr:hypothetical protein Vi05172_g9104 [Venturia inaequalis]
MSRTLKKYIDHCPDCLVNKTPRHLPYGELHPIVTKPAPFVTICIDFVTNLPPTTSAAYDTLLTVTCKFSKTILLIPGKSDWSAEEWVAVLLRELKAHNWGIPTNIISDRDSRFMDRLWKAMFAIMRTKFMFSTAWHPQTDGQSERTNQTVEIAIRYETTANPDEEGTEFLVHRY